MELENKIKCVLMDFEINEITLQEATKQIFLLLDVVGQSGKLVCEDCGYEINPAGICINMNCSTNENP